MKMTDIRPHVEASLDMEEKLFSIDDLGMIFDILRNKMYSNPILAICREYSCNARDAHREVGTPDLPIHIHLPNHLEPYYKIKDFGLGISPDRMENVFIKYTASTKRNDNVQTGGFGLGCKSGFAYADSFSITTNYNGMQYQYSCFIDSTKVGKLTLLHSEKTSQPNGTEIQIPVLPTNFKEFLTWTVQACKHWDVKPIIKGGIITWEDQKIMASGDGWAIVTHSQWDRSVKVIIDEIEYPLDLTALEKYSGNLLLEVVRKDIQLYFGVGELSLSASREQIYLDKRTQKLIDLRLSNMLEEIKRKTIARIDSFPNLWEANVYWQKELTDLFNQTKFLAPIAWHNIEVAHASYLHLGCRVYHFTRGRQLRRGYVVDPNKIVRSIDKSLLFTEDSELYVNDLPLKDITTRHLKKLFEANPNLKSVQVIYPSDKLTIQDLDKKFHLSAMKPKQLSSIIKASRRAPSSSKTPQMLVFKFDGINFVKDSYTSMVQDSKDKVLILLSHARDPVVKNKAVSVRIVQVLSRLLPDRSFYGVYQDISKERLVKDLSGMIPLEKVMQKILDESRINCLEVKAGQRLVEQSADLNIRLCRDLLPLIKEKGGLFARTTQSIDSAVLLTESDKGLSCIHEALYGIIPDQEVDDFLKANHLDNLTDLNRECEEKYPLLSHLRLYYEYKEIRQHIAQYINLIDAS
jgi:hypothetical protein